MTFRFRTFCLAAAAIVVAAPALALDFVTGPDYPPFADEKLPGGGMTTELVGAVYKALGQDAAVKFMSWKRGYEATLAGEAAGTFPYVKTPEREKEFVYSESMFDLRQLVYAHPGSGIEFNTAADLKGKKVCGAVGYAIPPELQAMVDKGELKREQPADLAGCFRLVSAGRADFVVSDEIVAKDALKLAKIDMSTLKVSDKPFDTAGLYLIVGKKTAEAEKLVSQFNEGLAKLKASGEYEAIVKKYVQ
ncbi:MAG TPA: transporter substrate-binding domain-containing protein [Alphaproteobacteria bacterium]|nr:transporter substrate-binding domain-containing protein [Alphaproteobacteria bacterium]